MTTPPRLTQAEYIAFLGCLPVHPSELYFTVNSDNVEEVKEFLVNNPILDCNWRDGNDCTALFSACRAGSDIVVSILLIHPGVDVNLKNNHGRTPFMIACDGHTSCVRELLKDSRVKVNEPNNNRYTPLWIAARNGHLDIIKSWIASGREMDLGTPGDVDQTDAIGVAKKKGKTEVVSLLERFKENSLETRHAMRVELGLLDDLAAEMFAMVVFVSDGLLQVKDTTTPSPAARFFRIARNLPLEFQMVLCYRVVGSAKEIIPGKESEVAFKKLARRLW